MLVIQFQPCFFFVLKKGIADEGVTPKASQIFVFFLPKATFGSYERTVIFIIRNIDASTHAKDRSAVTCVGRRLLRAVV